MLQAIFPFEVIVTNPLRAEKEGGLKKGTHLTVRFFVAEHQTRGMYLIYFLVWNENKKNFMLEEAAQFTPVQK